MNTHSISMDNPKKGYYLLIRNHIFQSNDSVQKSGDSLQSSIQNLNQELSKIIRLIGPQYLKIYS
jgi:hypothetical protein